MKNPVAVFCLIVFLLVGCQSENSTEPPPDTGQRLHFTPAEVTVSGGEQTSLRLVVENLTDSIFAISLRISYRDSILTFAGVAGAESGDFFGADAIQFAQDTLSVLHITISRIQGQTEVNGSGTICTFRFVGRNAGNCVMEILPDQLEFYDSAGRTIEVPNLEIKTASVHVI